MHHYQFELREVELSSAVDALQKHRTRKQWYWPVIVGLMLWILLQDVQYWMSLERVGVREILTSYTIIPLLVLLAMRFVFRPIKSWTSMTLSTGRDTGKRRDDRETFTVILSDSMISRQINDDLMTTDWNQIEQAVETNEFLLFYLGGTKYICLPQRIYLGERSEIDDFLTRTLGKRYRRVAT